MPTHEPIESSLIPREIKKPIPDRIISTRPRSVTSLPQTTENVAKVTEVPDQQSTAGNAKVAESTTPEESVKLSPQLSALARKEAAFRQREQLLKQREKDLEAKLADAEKFSQLKTKLSSKDYSEAESLGLSYEGYTEYLLSKQDGEKSPESQALKKLESEVEALKKGKEESAAQEYEETVNEYRKEITALIDKDPQFSSVKELKREDAVLQLILDSWEEDGTEVTVEQAAKDIEEYLVEEATKMAGLTKVKSKLEAEQAKKLPPPKPGLKTLTQQVSASSEKRPAKSLQYLSESERYAEARRRVEERKRSQQA